MCVPAFPLVDACLIGSGLYFNINCRKWAYCEAWLVPPLILSDKELDRSMQLRSYLNVYLFLIRLSQTRRPGYEVARINIISILGLSSCVLKYQGQIDSLYNKQWILQSPVKVVNIYIRDLPVNIHFCLFTISELDRLMQIGAVLYGNYQSYQRCPSFIIRLVYKLSLVTLKFKQVERLWSTRSRCLHSTVVLLFLGFITSV